MSNNFRNYFFRHRYSLAVFALLNLACALCIALVAARVAYSESGDHLGLIWNLFLAWIPLLAAVGVYDMQRRSARVTQLVLVGALWLLFLPNAPYLLTDLIHLGSRSDAPLWFDLVLFSAFAWTGALLGFLSLYLMQAVVRRAAGGAWSWAFVGASLVATSFGIYLGRSLRWNSWALITNPSPLLSDIWARLSDPLAHPRSFGMTVALTALLSVLYLVLYAFAQLPAAERASR